MGKLKLPYNADNIHPGFSIDCVILSFYKGKLKVLLNKFYLKSYWALPGGFMFNEEDADQAACRILQMRTGLTDLYLRQFYLFSDPKRTVMAQNEELARSAFIEESQWLLRRFVTVGYIALVKYEDIKLSKIENESAKWYDIDKLPNLYSDHENIIKTALNYIRDLLPIIPIGYALLPEKFTMTELRKIYENILGRSLDRRNFQRKILSEGLVIQLDEKKSDREYNPPILYSFNPSKKDIF
jgi:hypothetical protein